MKPEIKKIRDIAIAARSALRIGAISMDEAKRQAKPYIDAANKRAKEMAREFKITFRPISMTGFLR